MNRKVNPKVTPRLIVISGPSGAGKDTLAKELVKKSEQLRVATHAFPKLPVRFATTATTRTRRDGEKEGINHYFLTRLEFDGKIAAGDFLEHAEVYGNLYGVPKEEVEKTLADGKHSITRVDVQGARSIRRLMPNAVLIFIAPSSLEELRTRLVQRKANSEVEVQRRLQEAKREISESHWFNYRIVNATGGGSEAVIRLATIISHEEQILVTKSDWLLL